MDTRERGIDAKQPRNDAPFLRAWQAWRSPIFLGLFLMWNNEEQPLEIASLPESTALITALRA